jgi:hypothetical protein
MNKTYRNEKNEILKEKLSNDRGDKIWWVAAILVGWSERWNKHFLI